MLQNTLAQGASNCLLGAMQFHFHLQLHSGLLDLFLRRGDVLSGHRLFDGIAPHVMHGANPL